MSESLHHLAQAQYWAMERVHLAALLRAAQEMSLSERVEYLARTSTMEDEEPVVEEPSDPYELAGVEIADGLAILPVRGTIVKQVPALWRACACEACGMTEFQSAARCLAEDRSVRSVLLAIESPGGTVGGVAEAADAVRRLRAAKPVHAAISDLGASAAYWIASQAETVAANMTAHVGSIGVYTVIEDDYRAARASGIDVTLVASGREKGAGAPGVYVTPEQIEGVRENVEDLARIFASEVQAGRRLSAERLAAVTSGRTWIAPRAQALGLVDVVETFGETLVRVANAKTR